MLRSGICFVSLLLSVSSLGSDCPRSFTRNNRRVCVELQEVKIRVMITSQPDCTLCRREPPGSEPREDVSLLGLSWWSSTARRTTPPWRTSTPACWMSGWEERITLTRSGVSWEPELRNFVTLNSGHFRTSGSGPASPASSTAS